MNGTMKKRIVAGLLALGMILSPSGAGLTTIPSFAETGASAEAGNGSTDGDETTEGDSDSDGGETDPEDEDGSTDNGEDSSDNGETDPDNDENDSDEDKTEGTAEDAAADESTDGNNLLNASNTEIIGTTDVLEKYGDEVLPNYIIVNSDIFDLPEGFEISENLSVNSYKPTIYSSSEGYNALNAKQKKAYETLLARAEEIDSNEENYGYKYTYTYSDGSTNTAYYFGKNLSKNSDYVYPKDLQGYVFCEPGTSFNDIWTAYNALTYDNPQLFWLGHAMQGFNFRNSSGKVYCAVVMETEVLDYANGTMRQTAKTALYEKIDEIVDGAAVYANGYSAEWYIHDYLCKNTIYDPELGKSGESPFDHDVTGLLLHGVCVCESYAKCTQLLINAVTETYDLGDLEVRYVVGMAYGFNGKSYVRRGGHAWNQIRIDGQWYNLDATWSDVEPKYQATLGDYTYDFFNVTDDPFTKEHHAFEGYSKIYSTSKCTSTDYSYDNHDDNYVLEEDVKFTVNVDGTVVNKTATAEAAIHYISRLKNAKADYVINFVGGESDSSVVISQNVTLENAKSITFEGVATISNNGKATYNFTNGFTANCDVIFDSNAILSKKVTAAKATVTVNNVRITFDKDSEINLKSLALKGNTAFVEDNGAKSINLADVTAAADIYAGLDLVSDATIGTVTVTGGTVTDGLDLRVKKGANVTITGKVTCNGTAKVNLILTDTLVGTKVGSIAAENGTTIINAKTAPATCFKSSYIPNTVEDGRITDGKESDTVAYAVYKVGTEVKVTTPRVHVQLMDDPTVIGSFATFDEAVAAVNADKNLAGESISILLADDVETAKMTMPSKAGLVYISSVGGGPEGCTITVDADTVTFPTEVRIDTVNITTKSSKGLTISAAKDLLVSNLKSADLKTIKGTAKGTLRVETNMAPCAVTGFGTMHISADLDCGTINVGKLLIGDCKLNVKNAGSSVTVKDIEGLHDDAAIVYDKNTKPVTVTGTAKGSIAVTTENADGFTVGQKIITAKTADMSVFKLDEEKVKAEKKNDNGYTLTRKGSDLCVGEVVMSVEITHDASVLKFASWTDVVSTIESRKAAQGYAEGYTVTLLDNVNVGTFKMPKAGTYNFLYFKGGKVLTFTGNITLTGNTTFDTVILASVKKDNKTNKYTSVAYNIAAGKNEFTLKGLLFHSFVIEGIVDSNAANAGLANITSSGRVNLDESKVNGNVTANDLYISHAEIEGSVTAAYITLDEIEDTIDEYAGYSEKAANSFESEKLDVRADVAVGGNFTAKTLLKINESLAVKGTFSAVGIESLGENAKLYLYEGKKPADIGKTGFKGNKTVELVLLDSEGNTLELKTIKTIANIKGKYADHFIPVNENIDTDEQEVGYYIVKSGTQLIAKPKNTDNLIKVSVNGRIGYYDSYDSIIKDINTVADSEAVYEIFFGEEVELSKLTLPGAKKYKQLIFTGEGKSATIKTNSDLTLTGDFTVGTNITINKLDKNNEIVPMNVNAGTYAFVCRGKISYKDDANNFGKLSGSKKSSITLKGTNVVYTSVSADNMELNGTLELVGKAPLTLTGKLTSLESDEFAATIKYAFANASKIKFGTIYKAGLELVSTDNASISEGTYVANVTCAVLGGITVSSGENTAYAIRSGNKLIAGSYDNTMLVMNENVHAGCYYDTFENAIAGITAANDPDAIYKFYILDNAGTVKVNKLTMPAAKKYKSIEFTSRFTGSVTVETTSDLVLTGDTIINSGISINKVKNGTIVPISINTGAYTFTCKGTLSDKDSKVCNIANITGKGSAVFDENIAVNISGNVNVGSFTVSSEVTLSEKSGFTCANLVPNGGELVYTEKNAAKVKLGNIEKTGKSIIFPILGEGKCLAAITGDFPDGTIRFGVKGAETELDVLYAAVRKGNKIYISYRSDAVIVTCASKGSATKRAYSSPEDALADITRINDANAGFTIRLTENWSPKSIKFPAKGKYSVIEFVSGEVDRIYITVSSDITLTGTLVIGNNVTLRKAKGTLKITAPKGSGFNAEEEGNGKIEGTGEIVS